MFTLRPYQQEVTDAVHNFICTKVGNPCVSVPTGGGKSVIMAALIKRWQDEAPYVRGCILAHRKELVKQNYDKLRSISSSASDIGIYSAGLGFRDEDSPILYASIDSVYNKAGRFSAFDFLFVDEAHRIPFKGEGKYRTFISACKRFNPKIRIIGWTATPWRLAGGQLCHKDHILTDLVYDVKLLDLIDQGFLCPVRSKDGSVKADLSEVKSYSGGDYIVSSLSKACNKESLVQQAVQECVRIIKSEQRNAVVVYCVDVEHCNLVSLEFAKHGMTIPAVTSKTPTAERDATTLAFRNGKIDGICNVNVFTEGFDVSSIDCIVLLRPTLSTGLFSQMVGRGLRLHPGKRDCLVLDFAGCIDEHGPLDLLGGAHTVMAVCSQCRESFSRALGTCPQCGWVLPKGEIARLEDCERERRMHDVKASRRSILSNEPEVMKVNTIYVSRHVKPGFPDSIRIQYRCGLRMFHQWVCLDHPNPVGRIAQNWWKQYTSRNTDTTVNEALCDLFVSEKLFESIKTITVKKNGKYYDIVGYNQAENTCSANE
jgi:DNA repair protein RadD